METVSDTYIQWKQEHYDQDVIKSQYICHTPARKNTQTNSIPPFPTESPFLRISPCLSKILPCPSFLGFLVRSISPFKQEGGSNYVVLSRGILGNNESISKLPITRELSCSTISFAKQKVSLTVNSIDVIEFILGTKNFAILYDGVPIAEKIGLKGGHYLLYFYVLYKDHIKHQVLNLQL